MLTHQQILFFRTFGYVTLPGLLSAAEAAALRQEVADALAGAFGRIATERDDLGGISGDYLPLAVNRAPFSLGLIADDPRTFQSSAELLGSPTVPCDRDRHLLHRRFVGTPARGPTPAG